MTSFELNNRSIVVFHSIKRGEGLNTTEEMEGQYPKKTVSHNLKRDVGEKGGLRSSAMT